MLKLTGVDARRGPSLEAKWPCILVRLESSLQTLHDPAPARVIEDIAREFEGAGAGWEPGWATLALPALLARLTIALQRSVGPVIDRFEVIPSQDGCTLAIGCVDLEIGVAAAIFAARWV